MGGGYENPYESAADAAPAPRTSALQIFQPQTFPTIQFPSNPYNTGPLIPFLPFSESPQIIGFRIIAVVGTVYGGFDSPPRMVDQPWSATMSLKATVKKSGIADLQREAAACGANGLCNLAFTLRESNVGGDKIVTHIEATALAVRIVPI